MSAGTRSGPGITSYFFFAAFFAAFFAGAFFAAFFAGIGVSFLSRWPGHKIKC
jgi:hypothetical protein